MNPDRRESDFALIPAETLELWKNTGIAPQSGLRATAERATTRNDNAELWWWVLAMLAYWRLAESILGNRHMTASSYAAEYDG